MCSDTRADTAVYFVGSGTADIARSPLQAKDSDLAAIDPKQAAELPTASGKTTPENKHIHAATQRKGCKPPSIKVAKIWLGLL